MRWILLLVLILACGSERGETVTPDPATTVPEPAPPAPPPLEDPEPTPVRFDVPEKPEDLPELTQLERGRRVLSRTAAWSAPRHPDPETDRRLAMVFEHYAYARAFTSNWGGDGGYWNDARPYGGCRPAVATENLISMVCYRSSTHRGGNTSESPASHVHLSVVGQQIVPFDVQDIFEPGTDLDNLTTEEACVESVMSTGVRRMLAIRGCRAMLPHPSRWVMGPTGFVTTVDRTGAVGLALPYTLFREHLRADGPIAWLYAGPRPQLWVSERDASGFALTDVLPWPEMIMLATKLSDDALSEVRADQRGETARLVLPGTSAETLARAREIAEVLGTSVRRASWSSPHQLKRVRAEHTLELSTNAGEHGSVRRIVPVGTHLISIEPPTPARHVRAGSGLELVGYAFRSSLEDDEGCRPDSSAFLDSFGDQRDDAVPRLQIATTEVRTNADQATKVALFASTAGGRSQVRLVTMAEDCSLGDTLLDESLRGHLFDLRIGSFAEDGTGEGFLLAGVYQGERSRRYLAYRMSREANQRRVLADLLALEEWSDQESDPTGAVQLGHGEGEEWRPLVLGEQDYRWNGRMLVAIDHGDY